MEEPLEARRKYPEKTMGEMGNPENTRGEVGISREHWGQGGNIPSTLGARWEYPMNTGGEGAISWEQSG